MNLYALNFDDDKKFRFWKLFPWNKAHFHYLLPRLYNPYLKPRPFRDHPFTTSANFTQFLTPLSAPPAFVGSFLLLSANFNEIWALPPPNCRSPKWMVAYTVFHAKTTHCVTYLTNKVRSIMTSESSPSRNKDYFSQVHTILIHPSSAEISICRAQ